MQAETYALILLIFRLTSVGLIISVLRKQRVLNTRPLADRGAAALRKDMYTLAVLALSMNIIPIIVDVLTLFDIDQRPTIIPAISVLYMFSYSFGTLALTGILWRVYKKALEDSEEE